MYFDLHCDSIIKNIGRTKENLYNNNYSSVTIKQMEEVKLKGQVFAIYLYNEDYYDYPGFKLKDKEYIDKCISYLHRMEELYGNSIRICQNNQDYQLARKQNKTGIFLSIEDGRFIKNVEDINRLKDAGISLITLLWNDENRLGYPNSKDPRIMEKGLKDLGKEVIERMDELSMIIDVSHLSDGGFWDIARLSKKPLVASHSNSRTLVHHPRNLTDDMIKAIGESGGIIGANICPAFLNETPLKWESEKIDYLKHLRYIMNLGGENIIAIGSDFDGILGDLEISNIVEMNEFLEKLENEGFSHKQIEKISYKNAERLLKESLS